MDVSRRGMYMYKRNVLEGILQWMYCEEEWMYSIEMHWTLYGNVCISKRNVYRQKKYVEKYIEMMFKWNLSTLEVYISRSNLQRNLASGHICVSCRSLFAKEPQNKRLFGGKWRINEILYQVIFVWSDILWSNCRQVYGSVHISRSTEWWRPMGCLIFIGHFPQKSPMMSGSFAQRDLQLEVNVDRCMAVYIFRGVLYIHTKHVQKCIVECAFLFQGNTRGVHLEKYCMYIREMCRNV